MTFCHDDAAEENYDGVCLRTRDYLIRQEKPPKETLESERNGRSGQLVNFYVSI